MNVSTLSVGAGLRRVDHRDGHQVTEPFSVTNNLPRAQSAAATAAQTATQLGYRRVQLG